MVAWWRRIWRDGANWGRIMGIRPHHWDFENAWIRLRHTEWWRIGKNSWWSLERGGAFALKGW
jgi:hypothetical protein